jgi:hypothetical protein
MGIVKGSSQILRDLGPRFFLRLGSRILRVVIAKKPDAIGLFGGLFQIKALECAPLSWDMLGYMIVSARRGYHADPDALENRARPLLPCAPAASDVFAYSERAARRVSCIGACLVSKVKDHSVARYGLR